MVNQAMQRTKVLAVSATLVSAALAAVLLTGGASAATWHTYSGDMFAGHAYALDVPEKAQSIEFLFDGAPTGRAEIGVHAPDGKRAGYYELVPTLAAASVANPVKGRYVVYVYDVVDGALTVRVDAAQAPEALSLREIDLVRTETKIGDFEQGKLDQVITSELRRETVFVTLLYRGSASDLDATVSSAKGAVVTIADESATAFSPGVWTRMSGTRTFEAANLDGTKYEVEVHAAQFEGTMVLTTLSLKIEMPTPVPPVPQQHEHEPPAPPAPPAPVERPAVDPATAQFALEEGVPVAFAAEGATLVLMSPDAHGQVVVYTPDDEVLAVVDLTHGKEMATVTLPAKGEYVAYARHVGGDAILARIEGQAEVEVRTLRTSQEMVTIDELSGTRDRTSSPIDLRHVPLELELRFVDGIGTLSSLDLSNERGPVATTDALAVLPGIDMLQWAAVEPKNFARGQHTLAIMGMYEGTVEVTSLHYVREPAAQAAKLDAKVDEEPAKEPDRERLPIPFVGDLLPELPW